METTVEEIASVIYRISTYFSEIAAPARFTVHQFRVRAEQPLLFHCGMRSELAAGLCCVVRSQARRDLGPVLIRWPV